jgi:apolipoprotein N-acyltransferase
MDSKPDSYAVAAPCLAISATLFFLGTGLNPLWICSWIAAVPVLWLAPRVSGRYAFFVSAAAYALGGLNEWSYSSQILPIWLVASLLLFGACLFGLGVLLFRGCIVRHKIWQAVLILPAFWVVAEYLISKISIHGTFGNIGYSQMNFLPIVQVASVTGIWGISFCIFLFAAAAAAIFSATPWSKKISGVVVASLFLLFVFIFGVWRVVEAPKDAPIVKVALMASSAKGNFFAQSPEQLHAVLQRYADAMKPLSGRGIQLIILPEHTGPVTDSSQADADALLSQMARSTGAYVAVGIERIGANLSRNQERIYAPNGSLFAMYNKHHMLPPFESQFAPDTKRTVLDVPSGKWGVEICKDMDFPSLSREYSRDGIGMLIVSASDFVADGWLHGRMAVLRGVEGGFSVARSANLGILTATDDRGHVLSQQDTIMGPPFVTAIANIPVRRDDTIYSRFGDWFAWLSMALFLIALYSPGQPRSSDLDHRIGASELLPTHPADTELSMHTSR